MHQLVVPDPLPRGRVDTDDRLRVEVVARPVPAVHVVRRRRRRHVYVAQLRVGREKRPDGGVPGELPGAVGPGFRSRVARLRNGVEHPAELARPDVERADIATNVLLRDEGVGHRLAHHDDVAHDGRCAPPAIARPLLQPRSQTDPPVVAEGRDLLSGRRIERIEPLTPVRDEPPLAPVGPVRDAAVAGAAITGRRLVVWPLHPDRVARRRVPRLYQADRVRRVEHAADHQRRRPVRVRVAQVGNHVQDRLIHGGPRPGDAQLIDVVRMDLIERRVLRGAVVGAVEAPFPVRRAGLGGDGRRDGRHGGDRQDQRGRQSMARPHFVLRLDVRLRASRVLRFARFAIIATGPQFPAAHRAAA